MKTFKVTVKDDFFDNLFEADILAKNRKEAVKEAKQFYAMELDTTVQFIQIVRCVEA